LLLETGFLAIFLAPLQLLPGPAREMPPSRLAMWLLRWLLFRLMFASGCVKLLSGDPVWHNLTALRFHYETQPLPTWIGWYAHQFPLAIHKAEAVAMFVIELLLPFLVFAPRRPRQVACVGFTLLQVAILLTGNYCFFNLLTLALCLVLLDDAALKKILPARTFSHRTATLQDVASSASAHEPTFATPLRGILSLPFRRGEGSLPDAVQGFKARNVSGNSFLVQPCRPRWPLWVTFPVAIIAVLIPTMNFAGRFSHSYSWPRPLAAVYFWLAPFRSFNSYGLFAVMTTSRLEIIVQGSNDGLNWLDYEFKYKPGDLRRRPMFVEPHQPRLDWQMWFAALSDYRQQPWFINFSLRLLQGSPDVLALLERNPFPTAPPRYIRALGYEYHFTDWKTRRSTGAWWRRELKGDYLPVLSLRKENAGAR